MAAAAVAAAAAKRHGEEAAQLGCEAREAHTAVLDRCDYPGVTPLKGGVSLRQLLESTEMEFSDPITGFAIDPLPNDDEDLTTEMLSLSTPPPLQKPQKRNQPLHKPHSHPVLVTPFNLLSFLEAVSELWFRSGVERQVEAFRKGVSQVFDWRHLLCFSAKELRDMTCGQGDVEWSDKSLKKWLKPSSGFTHDSPTLKWLIAELVAMPTLQRRSFLKFSTAVPRLVPGSSLTVACKGSGGSWLPTAQTCTPQINLAVYRTKQDLSAALKEAMANADADGGFHERTAGSDGNSDAAAFGGIFEQGGGLERVVLPPSMAAAAAAAAAAKTGDGESSNGGGRSGKSKHGASEDAWREMEEDGAQALAGEQEAEDEDEDDEYMQGRFSFGAGGDDEILSSGGDDDENEDESGEDDDEEIGDGEDDDDFEDDDDADDNEVEGGHFQDEQEIIEQVMAGGGWQLQGDEDEEDSE